MPLLNKEPFSRIPLPENIDSDDEVFYCSSTQEAFTDYDQFFQRSILCSSMVWTCSVTGRYGLTFQEAIDSEQNAKSTLNSFPKSLQVPILYLVTCMNEHKLHDIVNMIVVYITNRYFVNEEIDVIVNDRKIKGRIERVIPPAEEELMKSSNENKGVTISYGCDPSLYKYEIEDVSNTSLKVVVGAERVTRPKGNVSKDKVKLFLKQHIAAEKRFQVMKVKDSSLIEFGIEHISWNHIFAGPLPNFVSETQVVRTLSKDKAKFIKDGHKTGEKKSKSKKAKSDTPSVKDMFQRVDKELLKQQKLEQKLLERERIKEEKRKNELIMKEWSKKREDLECDDLQALPEPIAVDCQIPNELFGDAIMIMEFLQNFSELLDIKAEVRGLTFEVLQEMLTSQAIYGPFGDLLDILLRTIFALQKEENRLPTLPDDLKSSDEDSEIELGPAVKDGKLTLTSMLQTHAVSLSNVPMSPFTITEILRLHILSSGAEEKTKSCSGGDDPCVWLQKANPELIERLSTTTVFELDAVDRLQILHALLNQIATFARFRDFMEESVEKVAEMKRQLRELEKDLKPEGKTVKQNGKHTKKDCESHNKGDSPVEGRLRSKTKNDEKIEELKQQIRKLQGCCRLKPLGTDRWSRKYWWFASLDGLFVESEELQLTTCTSRCSSLQELALKAKCFVTLQDLKNSALTDNSCYSYLSDDRSTASDKENDCTTPPKNGSKTERCGAKNVTPKNTLVHLARDGKNYCVPANPDIVRNIKWSFYNNPTDIETLISCLNNRGFRESELKKVLQIEAKFLTLSLQRCPGNTLNASVQPDLENNVRKKLQFTGRNRFKPVKFADYPPQSVTEAVFKFQCLKMEERLFDGGLCCVEFREQWRSGLEDETQILPLTEGIQYLLTLSKSICPQFLVDAFKKEDDEFTRWRESLLSCKSYSQLFFHMMTLDKNVMWSKSASNAQCIVCSKRRNHEKMLLCDDCNGGYHTYCVDPPLEDIPDGNWYCTSCAELRKPLSPRKVRRTNVKYADESTAEESTSSSSEDSSEDTSSSDSSSSSESSPSSESDDEGSIKVTCLLCGKGKVEINCSNCGASFHNNCHKPPITRLVRRTWTCFKCKLTDEPKKRENKTEEPKMEPQRKRMKKYNQDFDYASGKPINNHIKDLFPNERLSSRSLKTKCVDILTKLRHHQDSVHFRKIPTRSEAPHYYKVVKRPVDFDLITTKLHAGEYQSGQEFFLDIYLILQNCWLYYGMTSEQYTAGKRLFVFFKQLLSENGYERLVGSLH